MKSGELVKFGTRFQGFQGLSVESVFFLIKIGSFLSELVYRTKEEYSPKLEPFLAFKIELLMNRFNSCLVFWFNLNTSNFGTVASFGAQRFQLHCIQILFHLIFQTHNQYNFSLFEKNIVDWNNYNLLLPFHDFIRLYLNLNFNCECYCQCSMSKVPSYCQ